jgi:hypothetical protein
VRELNTHLPAGWGRGKDANYRIASSYADWIAVLEVEVRMPEVVGFANRSWKSLKESQPFIGWLPAGPNDPLIEAAFKQGWPEEP